MDFSRVVNRARQLRALNMFITERFDQFEKEANDSLVAYTARLRQARQDAGSSPDAVPSDRAVFPVAIKDAFCTKDIATTCASKMLANFIPPYSATVVDRLQQAGGVIIGKTNMDEFSMGTSSSLSYFGPAKSPYSLLANRSSFAGKAGADLNLMDDWILPGGSSGGSAIAVACGLAKIALGSDTGGSTRNPAAWCGVVGLKPSYGLLSRYGLIPLVNSLDVPGVMTANVRDAAWALDLMAGRDQRDSTSVDRTAKSYQNLATSLKGFVVGIPEEYHNDTLSTRVLDTWREVADMLADAGCIVKRVSMPHTHWSIRCYHVLGECDVASNMARYDGIQFGYRAPGEFASLAALYAASRSEAFNEVVRRRIMAGNYFLLREHYDEYYGRAMRVRRLIAEDHWRLFRPTDYGGQDTDRVDVLLTPVCSDVAPWHSKFTGSDAGYSRERADDFYTQPANMAGVPAISIPIRHDTNSGLPISLQLVADNFQEHKLLAVASYIEQHCQFRPINVDYVIEKIDVLLQQGHTRRNVV